MANTNKVDCYDGGIPNQGFNGTYPNSASQGTMFQPDPTKGEVDTQAGGPANGSGKSSNGGFVMTAGPSYDGPSDMEPGAMKVVDLNDVKGTV